MGHARARKIPAQLVEDEEYQLRHERVAGIDIAKAKADVCTRLPPARDGGRRASRVEEVPATAREILALAGRLLADGVELVVMESTSDYWRIWYYLLEAAGLTRAAGEPRPRPAAGRAAEDRPAGRAVDRPAGRDGPAAPVVRAAAGDPGAAGPDPHPAAAGPRPHPGVAAAGEAAGRRPGQAVVGGVARWPGPRPPAPSWRPSPTASATRRPWPPWPPGSVKGGRAAVEQALEGMQPRRSPPHADPRPPGPHHVPGPVRRRGRGRDRGRPGRDPRRLGHQRRRRPVPGPRPGRRGAARRGAARGDPRRQPRASPARSSPRPAWT